MDRKHTPLAALALIACALLSSCSAVDTFTVRDTGRITTPQDLQSFTGYTPKVVATATAGTRIATVHTIYRKPETVRERQLVLKQPCRYLAGADISGTLSPGPLDATAIGVPSPSNARTREKIDLIQVGDLSVHGKYDIKSYIGVTKDGEFVPSILLHSDMPGAPSVATENGPVRFTPKGCHYATEMVEVQRFVADPGIPPGDTPIIYKGSGPQGLRFAKGPTANGAAAAERVIPARPGTYRVFGLGIRIVSIAASRITYSVAGPEGQAP